LLREPVCHVGSHTELPGLFLLFIRGSFLHQYLGRCYSIYSIYPPIKDERLSRPEPMQVNVLLIEPLSSYKPLKSTETVEAKKKEKLKNVQSAFLLCDAAENKMVIVI